MALYRRDPTREPVSLRDAVDRIVRDNIVRPAADLVTQIARPLPLDIAETAQSIIVEASLPGLTANDVTITLQGDTVTIRGEIKSAAESPDRTWLLRERRSGAVERSVQLPTRVDPERAEARFENGVLILTLHKAESAAARRIPVNAAPGTTTSSEDQTAAPQAQPTFPGEQDRIAPTVDDEAHKDVVTEASMESFPASDPPSYSSGRG